MERLTGAIAVTITVAWFGSLVLDAAWPAYSPPATLHALMMLVAGWAFGERIVRRNGSGR